MVFIGDDNAGFTTPKLLIAELLDQMPPLGLADNTNVEAFVNELFISNNIPPKHFNNVLLCVSEAVVNSIQHGNKNDANKKVSIFADCESETIVVTDY